MLSTEPEHGQRKPSHDESRPLRMIRKFTDQILQAFYDGSSDCIIIHGPPSLLHEFSRLSPATMHHATQPETTASPGAGRSPSTMLTGSPDLGLLMLPLLSFPVDCRIAVIPPPAIRGLE